MEAELLYLTAWKFKPHDLIYVFKLKFCCYEAETYIKMVSASTDRNILRLLLMRLSTVGFASVTH
jgi:hypothetical protein